jgi:hypothetical protein
MSPPSSPRDAVVVVVLVRRAIDPRRRLVMMLMPSQLIRASRQRSIEDREMNLHAVDAAVVVVAADTLRLRRHTNSRTFATTNLIY